MYFVNKMIKYTLKIILFLFISSVFASENGTFNEYSATPEANRVVISWLTKNEDQLKHFVVQRSNDNKNFIDLDRVALKGPGYRYEYIDEDVLFEGSGRLFYKIVAIKQDGTRIESPSMIVLPNTTGIFRTWGAIKAMFR
jgi:hypothetical protein